MFCVKKIKNLSKKGLQRIGEYAILDFAVRNTGEVITTQQKVFKEKIKKLLTNNQHSGKISELLDKSDDEENQSTLTNKQ